MKKEQKKMALKKALGKVAKKGAKDSSAKPLAPGAMAMKYGNLAKA